MKKLIFLFCILCCFSGIAQLDANSVMGIPRVTTTVNMNAISGPSEGSMVYNEETNSIFIYDGTNWVSTTNDNWLVNGNTGATTSSFLGTIDDVRMEIRSNNTPMLQFGRRQTLGLTQGFPDYTDNDQPLVYVNGNGSIAALQFAASGASFYKPMFFTTSNGSFRLKGSTGDTDLFEIGSAGPSNDGRLEFIIGDDGAEPIIFKRYDYRSGQFHTELFRVQGSNNSASAKPRFGININPQQVPVDSDYDDSSAGFNIANSTLQVNGSISKSITATTGNLTLTEDHYSILIAGTHNITLPAANTCEGRIYGIKNSTGANRTISTYKDLTDSNQTTITSNTILWIQSDGTEWEQINNNTGSSVIRVFEAYDNTGGTAANETNGNYNTLNLDTQRINQGGFTLNNDRITIPETGIYEVGYTASFAASTNNNNSTIETILYLNSVEIDGSSTFMTFDNNGDDYSVSKTIIISLTIGDELRMASNRSGSSNGTVSTIVDGTNITIKKID